MALHFQSWLVLTCRMVSVVDSDVLFRLKTETATMLQLYTLCTVAALLA